MRRYLVIFTLAFLGLVFISKAQPQELAHEKKITAIQYSKDGKFLLSGGQDLKVRLWDVENDQMVYTTSAEFIPRKIIVSPDNKHFIITQNNGKNVLYKFKTGKRVKALQVDEVRGFSPDGKSIITVTYGQEFNKKFAALGFADIKDEYFTSYFSHSKVYIESELKDPVIAYDEKTILLPEGKKVYLFEKDKPRAERKIKLDRPADIVAVLPEDKGFVINGSDKIYQWKDNERAKSFFAENTYLDKESRIAISGTSLINMTKDQIKIFDMESGAIINRFDLPDPELAALDPTGKTYAYVENNTRLIVTSMHGKKSTSYFAADLKRKLAHKNYLTGIYFYSQKDYLKAKDYLDKTESLTKTEVDRLYFKRGEVNQQLGFYKQAIADFLIDHSLKPGRAAYKIAQSFAQLGEEEEAVQWLDSCLKYGIKVNRLTLLEDMHFNKIRVGEAFTNKTGGLTEREAMKLSRYSNKRLENKETLAALEFVNKAIEKAPEAPELYKQRARVYLELNENNKARKDFLKAAELDPYNSAGYYVEVAKAFSGSGLTDSTISWINKAIETDSSYISAMVDIAEIHEANYNRSQAITVLNSYLDMVPVDHYAVYLRASLIPMQQLAIKEAKKAIELCKTEGKPVPREYKELLKSLSEGSSRI